MNFFDATLRSVMPNGWSSSFGTVSSFPQLGKGCLAFFASLALFGPDLGHAQTGIDVPMRRDISATVVAQADAAPDDVVMVSDILRQEIEILRRELGVDDHPPRAESHANRRPVHVYVKALEVMSKVVAVQRRLGVQESSMPGMPLGQLAPEDVLAAMQNVLAGLRSIKTQMVIESEVETRAMSTPRTLSAAYKNLADSSAMLDGLVGRSLSPGQVFQGVRSVFEDLNLIAAKLQVPLDPSLPEVSDVRESVDAAQQALRAAYKIVLLQTRLGMDASAVPTLTLVRVTPTEAYDLIGILRAEIARIKWHLGINVAAAESGEPVQGKNFGDVFSQMLLVVRSLDLLTAGVES